jgi:GT2 family glycosyltransferase/MoaA/NifB/PqqE/SkfB family radical SAM enzyme
VSNPDASVIVITRNRPEVMRTCLDHLAAQKLPVPGSFEVIVVDSSSGGETWDLLKERGEVRRCRIVGGRYNTSEARNEGIRRARGGILAFLDDDAAADPGWLAGLLRHYADAGVGGAGGRLIDGRHDSLANPGEPVGGMGDDGTVYTNFGRHTEKPVAVEHLPGGNMSIRAEVLHRVGGFDPAFTGPGCSEETDLCIRVRRAGYRLVYDPDAAVRRVVAPRERAEREAGFDRRLDYYSGRKKIYFLLKNYATPWRRFRHEFLGVVKRQTLPVVQRPGWAGFEALVYRVAGLCAGAGAYLWRARIEGSAVGRIVRKAVGASTFVRRALRDPAATPLRFLNAMVLYAQFKVLRSQRVWGYPMDITVEPCRLCNLRCPACPTGERREEPGSAVMPLADFRRIIDRLAATLYSLELHNYGEPFLNREIFEMIRYAASRRIRVRLSTNLNHFNEADASEVVASGLHCLMVSADGVTQEVYARYRRGGDLDKVLANIRRIQEAKVAARSPTPHLVWMYVRTRENAHEADDARELARRMGMEFCLSELIVNLGLTSTFEAAMDRHRELVPDPERFLAERERVTALKTHPGFCDSPWMRVSINWDGGVWPCCFIYRVGAAFGNMLQTDFREIWNGRQFRRARAVIAGREKAPEFICEFCRRESG